VVPLRAAVVGLGHVGSAIARDLYDRVVGRELIVADVNRAAVERVSKSLRGVEGRVVDASKVEDLKRLFRDVDVAVSAVPGRLGRNCWLSAIEEKVDLVDVSYSPDDPLTLNVQAREAGITLVPDAGVAPGLSNILAGRASSIMDEVEELKIYVGAIPQEPRTPLGYVVTWSPEDLIEEYTRPARIIRDGVQTQLPALSEVERISIEGVGELEAFLTDGLRTMLRTLKNVRRMEEKTVRWPGHAERVLLLRTLGFLDGSPVDVGGSSVAPAALTARLLRERLSGDQKDLVVLMVRARGRAGLERVEVEYLMVDRYDEGTGTTAVARTTAFVATGIVRLLMEGVLPGPGVVPPEYIGMDEDSFSALMDWLSWKGIRVTERMASYRSLP